MIKPSIATRVVFEPANFCIYCGAKDVVLTDEHLVPDGMGGKNILPKSSCTKCQKIIHVFETYCQRKLLGNVRSSIGMKSSKKRPPQKPSALIIPKDGGPPRRVFGSIEELPVQPFLPILPLPTEFFGQPAPQELNVSFWTGGEPPSLKFLEKHGAIGIMSEEIRVDYFARFVAKIAHGLATANLGADAFEPYLPPVILGHDMAFHRLVGGRDGVPDKGEYNMNFDFAPFKRDHRPEPLLVAQLEFFSAAQAPAYTAIVGHLTKPWSLLMAQG